ncbi:thioredoxin family protein [Aquimarina rubra]|uniref:Thioredoxin family protein n=1 Tax=Aquimarina rubra TaxID=1920033 RepID=A0ABW5LMX5_9FLAO
MKTLKILVAVVLVIAVSAFAIDKVNVSDSDAGYTVGDSATDFKLKNIDDTMVSLADYKDAKGFIVIFTCNHCPYSVAYEDRIIALDQAFKSKGYPVIAINPNNPKAYPTDSFDNMKVRAKEKGFTFPYLFDDGQKIYPQYGATKTPHVYILEKTAQGNIVRYIGAIDNNYKDAGSADKKYVEDAVNALLKGEKVPVETTKAIGCSIKA